MSPKQPENLARAMPDIANEAVGALNTKVRGVIEAGQGTLLKVENWGKRRLAYEVQKQMKGMYLFFSYLGPAGLVEEVERNLRLTDTVIRTYSVKIADNVDPASRTSEVTDETFAKAATPRPDEEEIATGQANLRAVFGEDEDGAFDFEEAVFGSDDDGL